MRCSYKPAANQLWSIWYCLFTLLTTGYLIYLGIRRYLIFDQRDWKDIDPNAYVYFYIYVALHGFVLVLAPFFLITCCLKIGNLASDGERLGDRTKKIVDVLQGSQCCRKLKSAWQHGPPVAQTLHLIMAFSLLMAHVLIETRLFVKKSKYDHNSMEGHPGRDLSPPTSILQEEDIWSTDLRFLYKNHDDELTELAKGGNRNRYFDPIPADRDVRSDRRPIRSMVYGEDETSMEHNFNAEPSKSASFADVSIKLHPLLSNYKLYGISLLFLNYAVALFVYASVYPSVYWRSSKPFSFIFSCHLILHAFSCVFGFVGFQMLYRFQIHTKSDPVRLGFVLNEYLTLAVYVASCGIIFFSSSVVYGYGYNKFCLRLLTTASGGRGRILRLRGTKTHPVCCEGYSPHIAAILMLVLMVAGKAPILYDQMVLYHKKFEPITLVCIIMDVVYLFAWILLWLALTLKREWAFKVRYTNAEIGVLLGLQTDAGRPVTNSTLMVICGDDFFATDDESKRAAILQLAEKCGLGQHEEEVYWLKPSHASSGHADSQQNAGSPEMNNLLGAPNTVHSANGQRPSYQPPNHTHQPPHTKAATIGVSGGSYWKRYGVNGNPTPANTSTVGYSKVSFSDGEETPANYLQKPQPRYAQTRASGSYVRFSDDQQSNTGLNYDDQAAHEIVSTFGTLPRGQDYPRRRIIHDHDADFFTPPSTKPPPQPAPHQVQTLANVGPLKRTPSPLGSGQNPDISDQIASGMITYASVHKRSSSPGFRNTDYGRIIQQPPPQPVVPGIGDISTDSQNASRVSSYANIPANKQNWDAASLNRMDASRPPTGRPMHGNGNPPQQYHHHQHHYNMTGPQNPSPQPYASLPHPNSMPPGNPHQNSMTPGNGNAQRRHPIQTVALQPRSSPKHSPSLEETHQNGFNGRKLTSFSNSSSASGGAHTGDSTDTTPTQQSHGGLLAPTTNALTASGSSSSREMTPLSNASGSLNRPPVGNFKSAYQPNPIYGSAANRSIPHTGTPSTPGSMGGPSNSNHANDHGQNYYANRTGHQNRPPTNGQPMDALSASGNGRLLGLESHDRNDSANFSLTSSNESDNNQFVTSIV